METVTTVVADPPMATESASPLTVMAAGLPMATGSASPLTVMAAGLPMETVMTVVADLPMATGSASPLTVTVAGLLSGIVMIAEADLPMVTGSASPLIVTVEMPREERENPLPSLTALTSSRIPVLEAMKRIENLFSGLMTRRRVINNCLSYKLQRGPRYNAWDFFVVVFF